ncbi:hypothetical protein MBLNU457_2108t1 [Dothideomycetes sp. NU457]
MADDSASIIPQLQALVTYRDVHADDSVSDSDSSPVDETASHSDTSAVAEITAKRSREESTASKPAGPRVPGLSIYDQENWRQQEGGSSPVNSPLPKRQRTKSPDAKAPQTVSRPKKSFLENISPSGLEANTLNDTAQKAGLRLTRPQYRPIANGEKCICVIRLHDTKSDQLLFETGSQTTHRIVAADHSQAKVNAVRLAMRFVEEYKSSQSPKNARSPVIRPAPPASPSSPQTLPPRPPVASSPEHQSSAADSRPTSLPPESGGRENWIGILYEYCQHRHREPPNFAERANAELTAFSCTCDLTLPSQMQLVPGLYSAITVQSKAKKTQIVTFGSHADVHSSKVGAKRNAARTAVIALMAAGEKVVPPGEARLKNLFGIGNAPKEAAQAGLPIRPPVSKQHTSSELIEQGDTIGTSQSMAPAQAHARTAAIATNISTPRTLPVLKPRDRLPVTESQITAIIDDGTTPLNKKVLRMSELLALPAPQFQWSKSWSDPNSSATGADHEKTGQTPLISGGAVFRGLEKDKRVSDAEVRWLTGTIGEVRHERGLPAAREKSARLVLGVLRRIALDRVEEDRRSAEEEIESEVQEQIRAEAGYLAAADGEADGQPTEPEEEDLLISIYD